MGTPDIIYLQACDECYDEAIQHIEAVTWCADQQDHADQLCNGDGHDQEYDEEKDEYSELPGDQAYVKATVIIDILEKIRERTIKICIEGTDPTLDCRSMGLGDAYQIILRSLPKTREIADYCSRADDEDEAPKIR